MDDLAGAAALRLEGFRKLVRCLLKTLAAAAIATAILILANAELTLGLGAATLLLVLFFYHRVTTPRFDPGLA